MDTNDFENLILNEGYVFSKDDMYINFEKFESGKCNFCIVTGLSGSGKSTLSKDIAKKYKATIIELDNFDYRNLSIVNQYSDAFDMIGDVFRQYAKDYPDNWYKLKNNLFDRKELFQAKREFILYAIKYCKKYKNQKFIIEGIQIYVFLEYDDIKNYPLVIKNTSMIKSIIRRWKRNGGGKIDLIKELQNEFPQLVQWYLNDEKLLQAFIDSI